MEFALVSKLLSSRLPMVIAVPLNAVMLFNSVDALSSTLVLLVRSRPLHTLASCSSDSPTWPYWHRANTEYASSFKDCSTL